MTILVVLFVCGFVFPEGAAPAANTPYVQGDYALVGEASGKSQEVTHSGKAVFKVPPEWGPVEAVFVVNKVAYLVTQNLKIASSPVGQGRFREIPINWDQAFFGKGKEWQQKIQPVSLKAIPPLHDSDPQEFYCQVNGTKSGVSGVMGAIYCRNNGRCVFAAFSPSLAQRGTIIGWQRMAKVDGEIVPSLNGPGVQFQVRDGSSSRFGIKDRGGKISLVALTDPTPESMLRDLPPSLRDFHEITLEGKLRVKPGVNVFLDDKNKVWFQDSKGDLLSLAGGKVISRKPTAEEKATAAKYGR